MESTHKGRKNTKIGVVVSNGGDKTVTVKVESVIMHPLYHRFVRRSRKFRAHDELNDCQVCDKVQITESRPLSRSKRWRVSRVVERAK